MKTFTAKVDDQGRITIPATLRELWGVKSGEYVILTYKGKEVKS